MRFALVALVLAPLVASADVETEAGKLAAAIRARNAKAVAKQLGTSLTNGGVWFPDAACAKRFATPGIVPATEIAAFARCLSKLELLLSTRGTARPGGAVLTYKPGVELELAFVGSQLRWVGMPVHDREDPLLPTLTVQAFEALRTEGTTLLDDALRDKLTTDQQPASAWVKTCLDATGAVTLTTHHRESGPGVGNAFVTAIKDWRFKPFTYRGRAQPACSLSLLTVPAAKAPAIEVLPDEVVLTLDARPAPPRDGVPYNVPPTLLESLRLTGTKQIVPDEPTRKQMLADRNDKVVASIKMCLDTHGLVTKVTLLKSSGYTAYDSVILGAIKQWTYRPYVVHRTAVVVCTAVVIIYDPKTTAAMP